MENSGIHKALFQLKDFDHNKGYYSKELDDFILILEPLSFERYYAAIYEGFTPLMPKKMCECLDDALSEVKQMFISCKIKRARNK